jgi:hypothetical protein
MTTENEFAAGAVRLLLQTTKDSGHPMVPMCRAMFSIGGLAMAGGPDGAVGAAAMLRQTAHALETDPRLASPKPERSETDHALYIGSMFDSAPSGYDRKALLQAGLAHCALSIAAIDGGIGVADDLESLARQIREGIAQRKLRSGDIARDYN